MLKRTLIILLFIFFHIYPVLGKDGIKSYSEEYLKSHHREFYTSISPIRVPEPRYPAKLQSRGKKGKVTFTATIQYNGKVSDVQVIEEQPENYGLEKSAINWVRKLKYKPIELEGSPINITNVEYTLTFRETKHP